MRIYFTKYINYNKVTLNNKDFAILGTMLCSKGSEIYSIALTPDPFTTKLKVTLGKCEASIIQAYREETFL